MLTPLVILGLGFFLYLFTKDYLTSTSDLNKAVLIIDTIHDNTYIKKRILKPAVTHNCLDISIKEQRYFVRLSDGFHSNKWVEIQDEFSNGDTLEILYKDRLLQDTVLYNPTQVRINNKTIISFEKNRLIQLFGSIGIFVVILLFILVFYMAYNTYKEDHLNDDKILYKKNKWKIIGRWLGE